MDVIQLIVVVSLFGDRNVVSVFTPPQKSSGRRAHTSNYHILVGGNAPEIWPFEVVQSHKGDCVGRSENAMLVVEKRGC